MALVPLRYRAMDRDGRIRRGRMEAAHELDLEARLQTEAGTTSDSREGVKAFLEKREAKFEGA